MTTSNKETSAKQKRSRTAKHRTVAQKSTTLDVTSVSADRDAMIAEAAYFLAERRDFAPGFEDHDWFKAAQDIDAMLSAR